MVVATRADDGQSEKPSTKRVDPVLQRFRFGACDAVRRVSIRSVGWSQRKVSDRDERLDFLRRRWQPDEVEAGAANQGPLTRCPYQ